MTLDLNPEVAIEDAIDELMRTMKSPRDTFQVLQFGFLLTINRDGDMIVVNVSRASCFYPATFGIKVDNEWTGTVFVLEDGYKIETIAAFRPLTEALVLKG